MSNHNEELRPNFSQVAKTIEIVSKTNVKNSN